MRYLIKSYLFLGILIGAILLLTALGYVADKWLDNSPFLLILGIVLGLIIGFYEIAKVTFKK